MKLRSFQRYFLLFLTLFLLLGFVACEDDDDDNIIQGRRLVDDANDALAEVLTDAITNGAGADEVDLAEPYAIYLDALKKDSNNLEANFGAGMLGLQMVLRDPDFLELKNLMEEFHRLDPFVVEDGVISSIGQMALPALAPLSIQRELMAADDSDVVQFSQIQDGLKATVLTQIDKSISYLRKVDGHTDFGFTITPAMQGDPREDAIVLDQTEVRACLAVLDVLKALIHQVCAYDFDLGDYTGSDLLTAFTPGSPFGALRTNGAADMAAAGAAWMAAVNDLEGAIASLEAESTTHMAAGLIKIDPYEDEGPSTGSLADLKANLVEARSILTGDYVIELDPEEGLPDITMNLPSLFQSPVVDWKAKAPAYTVALTVNPGSTEEYSNWDTFDVLIDFPGGDYYHWYTEFYYDQGEVTDEWHSGNFESTALEAAQQDYMNRFLGLEYFTGYFQFSLSIDVLAAGEIEVPVEVYIWELVAGPEHYAVQLTWDAENFQQWTFPDPTFNGLLPQMTDSLLKQYTEISEETWERQSLVDLSGFWPFPNIFE